MKAGTMILTLQALVALNCAASAAPVRVGASLDYHEAMRSYRLSGDRITEHYDAVGASLLGDFGYLRLSLGALHNVGNMITFADGAEMSDPDYRIAALQLAALGKLPFELGQGSVALWPASGLRLDVNGRNEYQGEKDALLDPSPTDFSVLLGGGIDYALDESWALTGTLLGAYCLTPSAAEGTQSPVAFGITLNAGVLFSL